MDAHNEFIIDSVEACVKKFPTNVAIIDADFENGKSINYREMWERTCRLSSIISQHLCSRKINNDSDEMTPLISIMVNRGIGSIVCILAVLKAGAAYVPVDPSFPSDRQEYIFTHSKSQLLLVDESSFPTVQLMGQLPPVILVDAKTGLALNNEQNENNNQICILVQRKASELSLAYVLYTSGSTGKPKGVMVQNKGLSNTINFFTKELKVTSVERVLGLTTLCFDISMVEVFLPLINGATLVIVSAKTQKNPFRILDVIRDHKLTIVQATPTSYEMLISCDWNGDPNIHFIVGGEAVRPKVAQLALNSRSLTNGYGPTETTIYSTSYRLPNTKEALDKLNNNIPIGAPISGTYFHIVDEEMNLLPDGQEGELLIGGDGVALGYIHAPDLTEKRFIKNPYGDPGMVYRTGDLASKLPDGTYAFARRLDDQVKISGFRIELGEVEVTMSKHPQVAQAAVIVKDDNLIGYVLLKQNKLTSTNNAANDIENSSKKSLLLNDELSVDIKQFMSDTLPKYMIPKYIIMIDDIPKTSSGKLDRLALAKLSLPLSILEPTSSIAVDIDTTSPKEIDHHQQQASPRNHTNHNQSSTTYTTDHSMLNFVLQKVLDVSGRKPTSTASFAGVGVDSLIAVIFRVQLSKSLGGIAIDQNKLYDMNTTIAIFSIDLYHQMKKEKPELLERLNIYCAINDDTSDMQDDDIELGILTNATNINKNESALTLNSYLLWNRKLFDGLRGVLIIFVLRDHFFNQANQTRIGSDTFMFIIISGLLITLQSIAYAESNYVSTMTTSTDCNDNKNTSTSKTQKSAASTKPSSSSSPWNAIQFLTIRAVAIFPMYWLAILLCAPRIYVAFPHIGLSDTQFSGLMILYIFALENWTCWSHQVISDLYYVSFIWGIFLIYALYMTVYYFKYFNFYVKWIGLGLITGWVIGMYFFTAVYKPRDGTCIIPRSPASGFIYFVIGTIASYLFNYLRIHWIRFQSATSTKNTTNSHSNGKNNHNKNGSSTSNSTDSDCSNTNDIVVDSTKSLMSTKSTLSSTPMISNSSKNCHNTTTTATAKSSKTSNASTSSNASTFQNQLLNNFKYYSNDIHSKWMTATAGIRYAYITRFGYADMYWALTVDCLAFFFLFVMFFHFEKYDMPNGMYSSFDSIMRKWGFPVYFSMILIVILCHSHADSMFTFVLKESYVFKLLGECSLPIYLYNMVIVKYIVPKIVFSIHSHKNQFIRQNDYVYGIPPLYFTPEYKCLGVVITVIFGIFIQKIFQDKLMMSIYIWSLTKWKTYYSTTATTTDDDEDVSEHRNNIYNSNKHHTRSEMIRLN